MGVASGPIAVRARLKVNQDELRQDHDEWRWRAERLLADLQRGAWWRWWNRAAAALDAVTASFCRLLASVLNKLSQIKANRMSCANAATHGAAGPSVF
jgi:hypothetical protein